MRRTLPDRLGPYELTAKIGEGGMGEVYQATDTRLKREVALKVLPEVFAADAQRLARFEREAQLLAQLQHPNIASIYGLEEAAGVRALVMELIPGPTLAERLADGALPVTECLRIARQIVEALEEAHEKGIVHRDLKPQNIKAPADGKVKVLDFGLAKALDPIPPARPSASRLAESPTMTMGGTEYGVILGTAAYMAPEQAKGLPVDKRADIWAFGVVLFEMLSGSRLFEAPTVQEILALVLTRSPELARLPPATPARVRYLLGRCLESDPKRRLRDIGEARLMLEQPDAEKSETASLGRQSRTRERLVFAGVAVLCAALGWAVAPEKPVTPGGPLSWFEILPPENAEFDLEDGPVTLSPDGRSLLALVHQGENSEDLLGVRSLDAPGFRWAPGIRSFFDPFWSPDSRHIGYFGDGLMRISASGHEPPVRLADSFDGRGATWSHRGVILYAPRPAGGLFRVSAEGGDAVQVTTPDAARGEVAHVRPQFLPDGNRFLYLIKSERAEVRGIYVSDLTTPLKKRVLAVGVAARFVPPDTLLTVQESVLLARRFDLDRLEEVGEAVTVASDVAYVDRFDTLPISGFEGGLLYHPRTVDEVRQLGRYGRDGRLLQSVGEPGDFNIDMSPDGSRVAVTRLEGERREPFLWIHDLARGASSRFDSEAPAKGPVWSPDGSSLAYVVDSATDRRLAVRAVAGGPETTVWKPEDAYLEEAVDWSPNGQTLLVETGWPGQRGDLHLLPATGVGERLPFASSRFNEHSGRFAPDGQFIAYVSDHSGREEIYLEAVPRNGARQMVSNRGGSSPRWAANGSELFYVESGAEGWQLVSVTVTVQGDRRECGAPRRVFAIASPDYEVLSGDEFLVGAPVAEAKKPPPVFLQNWRASLGKR
jgi:eukaryotic-like serine/threonine-protein kinase